MFFTDRLEIRTYRDDGKDLEFMMQLGNNLDVQKLVCTEYVVPRGPMYKDTITGWVNYKDLLYTSQYTCLSIM
jgi:hypothetical protein